MTRLPLRFQLLAVLVLLLILAYAVAAVAAPRAMESYLVSQVDTRITRAAAGALRALDDGRFPRGAPPSQQLLPSDFVIQVHAPDGSLIGSALRTSTGTELELPPLADAVEGQPFTEGAWRVLVHRSSNGYYLVAATSMADVQSTVAQSRSTILVTGGIALVALIGLGYFLVRRSFRPLEQVEHTAEQIAAGDLSRRVPVVDAHSEVGHLATALNTMLTTIESAFRARQESEARLRRFVADASHELRSPLTSIRGYAELYRQGGGTPERSLARIEAEATRMTQLVEDMLLLANLDQQRPLNRGAVDLTVLAVDAVQDARAAAPDRDVTLHLAAPGAVVPGDEARLRQVLANLLTNAIQHSAGPIRVGLSATATTAVITVTDAGPGMSPEQIDQVFDRFYRASASRSRDHGGTGLGLSIAAALVAAHNGTIAAASTPDTGSTFTVTLPLT
ncbi:sensor histidine kinase [Actinokineospora xionganensis]|uniref:histidine kinase n=1 Tax=Actinokineospora xionganensis TaxID=2684470 RepID=A0ABR7LC21_9PSEU|nr:HAMP domain-containing sensor histidine kinase [Actinokineospora xionganensis]MBC6450253.1 HAMP domain-containing histidine kinase [Actinokineospora xionganensis]